MDLRDLSRVAGPRFLFAGFLLGCSIDLLSRSKLNFTWLEGETVHTITAKANTYFMFFISGPVTILMTRIMCVDYPLRRQFRSTLIDLFTKDRAAMFFRGLPVFYFGQLLVSCSITAANLLHMQDAWRKREDNRKSFKEVINRLDMLEDVVQNEPSKWKTPQITFEQVKSKLKIMSPILVAFMLWVPCNALSIHVQYARYNASPQD